jgi:hypothetical protein
MSDVETLFVSCPVGVALFCWLFFEITKQSSRVERLVVRRRIDVGPISPKHGALSDARRP